MNMVALGEVVTIRGGGTPDKSVPAYWNGNIPWASVKDFKDTALTNTIDRITEVGVAASATQIIPAGNIIVPTRMAVGKAAINTIDLAINQDLKALIPSDDLDRRYLLHALLANAQKLEDQATGATVKGIKLDALRSLQIPLPPVPEQKRIAGILDQADALRRLRARALEKLSTLGQAIFQEMFGDALTGNFFDFADAVKEFRYGTSNKAGVAGLPTLRIPNVMGGRIDATEIKTVQVTDAELSRLRLHDGDMLFVRTNGNAEYVGRCAVFSIAEVADTKWQEDWIFASYLIRARLSDRVNPVFASTYFASQAGRGAIRERCKTSAGQFNINTDGLASLPFPDVSRTEQDEFANAISDIEQASAPMKQSAIKMDEKFASLQHRAFRGEL